MRVPRLLSGMKALEWDLGREIRGRVLGETSGAAVMRVPMGVRVGRAPHLSDSAPDESEDEAECCGPCRTINRCESTRVES